MKSLLISRHAKSSWAEAGRPDHDRPLNTRGKRAAERMGRLLGDEGLVPDHVLCSTARRARKTAKRALRSAGYEGELALLDELYLAPPASYLDALATLEPACERVLVIGHNPGLENLLTELTGAYEALPTAALAHVQLSLPAWHAVHTARGQLLDLWRPRALEDA